MKFASPVDPSTGFFASAVCWNFSFVSQGLEVVKTYVGLFHLLALLFRSKFFENLTRYHHNVVSRIIIIHKCASRRCDYCEMKIINPLFVAETCGRTLEFEILIPVLECTISHIDVFRISRLLPSCYGR